MDALTWKPEYEIGAPQIDEQHRQLVHLANDLYRIVENGSDNRSLLRAFEALINYTENHFREEEALWQQIDSPHLADQEKDHDRLAEELRTLIFPADAVAEGKVGANLKEWLSNRLLPHMMHKDQKAAQSLKD